MGDLYTIIEHSTKTSWGTKQIIKRKQQDEDFIQQEPDEIDDWIYRWSDVTTKTKFVLETNIDIFKSLNPKCVRNRLYAKLC